MAKPTAGIISPTLLLGLFLWDAAGCSSGGAAAPGPSDGPLFDARAGGPADAAPRDGPPQMTDGLAPRDLLQSPDLRSPPDLGASPDLRAAPDLAARPDLATSADMASAPDLAARPDLATHADMASAPDLASDTLVVRILARDDCTFVVTPPSYGVPKGASFKVKWENLAASGAPVDIDKNGNVPIVLDLGPGMSYDDMVHPWCGIFTGTFTFRILSCGGLGEYDLKVNCSQ